MKGRQYLSFGGELTPKKIRPIYDFGKKNRRTNKKNEEAPC